jgi:hypothetical protein
MTFRFVSNVDGMALARATRGLDAAETLFVISPKTFTTLETMTNAHSARAWALGGLAANRPSPGISWPLLLPVCIHPGLEPAPVWFVDRSGLVHAPSPKTNRQAAGAQPSRWVRQREWGGETYQLDLRRVIPVMLLNGLASSSC